MFTFKKWLFENDADHQAALRDTGFWGKQGAGCIIVAKNTGRILLPHRSAHVLEPHTWGTWGGAIDSDEDPQEAARREVEEEAGYSGSADLIPLAVFQKGNFKYHNFLAVVNDEFRPQLNWETQDYDWFEFGDWPSPLHMGLEWLLQKDGTKIKNIIDSFKS